MGSIVEVGHIKHIEVADFVLNAPGQPRAQIEVRAGSQLFQAEKMPRRKSRWVGTWTTPNAPDSLAEQKLRLITRLSLGDTHLLVRISNAFGAQDLAVGAAHLGLRR